MGADPDEIIFTSGATESNNLALFGLALRASPSRRRILVTAIEHKCVLAAALALEARHGFTVEVIPVDQSGMIDICALESTLGDDVLMASAMAVNNEVGTIQNIPRIYDALASCGIPLHCDAAQAPCALDIGKLANHADLVSISAHKMYGPMGIGALFIRRDIRSRMEPLIHGGGQQYGIRSGTLPVPLCVGIGAAAELVSGADAEFERLRTRQLSELLMNHLKEAGISYQLNGPVLPSRHPGNVNLCFTGQNAQDLLASLQPGLAASTGSACTTGMPEPSHVLRAMGFRTEHCDASIRFSFGRFTTEDEVSRAATLVAQSIHVHSATTIPFTPAD